MDENNTKKEKNKTNSNEKRKKHTTKKRQDVRREDDNNNKRTAKNKTKNRNTDLVANSLGPEPSFRFYIGVSFMLKTKAVLPRERGYFCCFLSVSLLFSLACLTSPFHSLSLLLFSYFLPSFFSWFFPCFFVFLSCLVSLLLLSCKEEHHDISSEKFFSSIFILFCWFPFFLVFKSPFFAFSFGPTSPNPALVCSFMFVLSIVVVILFCVGFRSVELAFLLLAKIMPQKGEFAH